jgi:hypothetical protein
MVQGIKAPIKTDLFDKVSAASETRWAGPALPLTLEERANLARNLYALHDWLKDHLQP